MHWPYLFKFTLITGLLIFAAALLTDKIIMPLIVHFSSEVKVPSVANLNLDDAVKTLENYGLTYSVKYRYNPRLADRTVLGQSPEPQSVVKSGRVIRLIVSQSELMVPVPSLKLSTLRDARHALENAGLLLGKISYEPSREFPEDVVINQSEEENTRIRSGSIVDITISAGDTSTLTQIPWLVTKPLQEAKVAIVEAKLRLGEVVKKYDESLLPGTVIAQSIDSARVVVLQTKVDLTVSSLDKNDQ